MDGALAGLSVDLVIGPPSQCSGSIEDVKRGGWITAPGFVEKPVDLKDQRPRPVSHH
jgi:hypothetical protein